MKLLQEFLRGRALSKVKMEPAVIEKLSSGNYGTWSEDAKVLLIDRNCWEIVTAEESQPAADASPKEIRDYKIRKGRAFSTIYLSIEAEYRPLISGCIDAKAAWDKLRTHFRPNTRARVIALTDEFFSCRMEEGEEVGLFAARLRKIISQLQAAEHPIAEWYRSFQLIRYLPPEFQGIVQSIYRWKDKDFTFDKVLEELLEEESRLKQCRGDREIVALHNVHGKKPNLQKSAKKATDNRKCFRCGKRGHLIASCKNKSKKTNPRQKQEINIVEALSSEKLEKRRDWVFDTAASTHFCANKDLFYSFKQVKGTDMSVAINGVTCPVEGTGAVRLLFKGGRVKLDLKNVMYSSKLRRNLISGPMLDKAGMMFTGKAGRINVYKKGEGQIFSARQTNGLYLIHPSYPPKRKAGSNLNLKTSEEIVVCETGEESSAELWHQRFCHINKKYISATSRNDSVRGMPEVTSSTTTCETCNLAKKRTTSHKALQKVRSSNPLQLLHLDVCGPLPSQSIGGHRFFLSITDDFSRKVTVYPLKRKNEVFECFKKYQTRNERFLNRKILNIRTDNGMEFCHNEFKKYLEDQGIVAERTNDYTPQQNGVSERFNYTALDAVKALLSSSNLGNGFWAEALLCFVYVWNRVCHVNQTKTPFELFGGRKPSVKHLRIFGSTVYVGTPRQLRNKLEMRSKKGILVGYAMQTKGYRVWIPNERKVIESINVRFDERIQQSNRREVVLDPVSSDKVAFPVSKDESDSETENENAGNKDLSDESDNGQNSEYGSDSESESQSKDLERKIPLKTVVWERQAVTRPDKSRTDIYYRAQGSKARLRSFNDVKKYCEKHNIHYTPKNFNFQGRNTYSGIVGQEESTSHAEA